MKGLNRNKRNFEAKAIQARKWNHDSICQKFRERKGETYIDVAITVMIVAFVLVFAVNVVSLVALNQNVKTAADQLTDYAAMNGTVSVDEYAENLKEKFGVDFTYTFAGSKTMDASGRVQLGEEIVCTLTYNLSILGFDEFVQPVTIRASSSGLSQVYWK